MRIRSTRIPEVTAPAGPPPRDSEALEHVLEALDAGVTGTPAFFIDGEPYRGFYDVESLVDALEDAGA